MTEARRQIAEAVVFTPSADPPMSKTKAPLRRQATITMFRMTLYMLYPFYNKEIVRNI